MLSLLSETVVSRKSTRLRSAYWHLRQWLPATVRTALRGSREFPVRPGEIATWLDEAHASPRQDLAGRRLVVFSYLPWWIDFTAAVSACLIGRGADVTFAWLPYWSFTEETPVRDAELAARYQPVLGKAWPRFRAVNLRTMDVPLPEVTDRLSRMAYVDTQYVRRREEIAIHGVDKALYTFRMDRLRHAYGAMTHLLSEHAVDSVLVPSGGVLEFAAAWQAAHDAGRDTVTMESYERLGTCAVGYGRPCFEDLAREVWESDTRVLDPERRDRVARVMQERENPNWTGHVISYQSTAAANPDELRAQFKLDDRRPIALVCPNVPYDAAFLGRNAAFPSMAEWLRAILRRLAARPDWQVLIRAHPGETALSSRQNAQSIVAEVIPTPLEHVHFIPPTARVNTYALMRIASVGFVYGSTTGLEMAARGLPVVAACETHYTRKGFTRDAFTRPEFEAAVTAAMDAPQRLSQEQIDLAWCYMDVYMNQWCRPFPWVLPAFARNIREWPLARVLGSEGAAKFDDTFTILAGGERAAALVATAPPPDAF